MRGREWWGERWVEGVIVSCWGWSSATRDGVVDNSSPTMIGRPWYGDGFHEEQKNNNNKNKKYIKIYIKKNGMMKIGEMGKGRMGV